MAKVTVQKRVHRSRPTNTKEAPKHTYKTRRVVKVKAK